jgi:polysaccharide biosynthesis protein PelE
MTLDSQTGEQTLVIDRRLLLGLLATLLVLTVEWGCVFYYVQGDISVGWFAVIHLTTVGCLLVWTYRQHRRQRDVKLPLLMVILTATTGPFGASIALVSLIFLVFYSKSGTSFLTWLTALFPEEKVERSIELYQRLSAGWDDFSDKQRIMTFQDAISLGTVQQKREALAKILRYYKREFAPALMKALHDPNNAIRVQAATVVAKFEQEYMSHYMELSRRVEAHPDDADLLLKMAQQADAYAYSGILDDERERNFREIAKGHYETYLRQVPDDAEAGFALGRIYIHLREAESAYQILKRLMAKKENQAPNLVMWLIESLYYLKKFNELKEMAELVPSAATSDSDSPFIIQETLKIWKHGLPQSDLRIQYTNESE